MAQQDKTDWYWNGELAGAVNNLYYDLINVDICHVPYATNHRNSSFFLKTRLAYSISKKWNKSQMDGYEVTDLKAIWEEDCNNQSGAIYAMGRKDGNQKAIFQAVIDEGCVGNFRRITSPMTQPSSCGDWKLFTTDFVRGEKYDVKHNQSEIMEDNNPSVTPMQWGITGIQINEYNLGTQIGLFTDENVKNGRYKFKTDGEAIKPGNYLLVYHSANLDDSGFAGQVRMVTGFDAEGRIVVDAPWLGFKVPEENMPQEGNGLSYAFFTDWGEVIGFSDNKDINIFYGEPDMQQIRDDYIPVYNQGGLSGTAAKGRIIGVASTSSKIFVLTENGYIHYSKEGQGYNKFFIDDDMFAGPDKIALTSYRDMILAFGRKHIAIGVPDDQDTFWTMYDQSQTIGLWSRYSFAEYDGDLIFVSNDKRLLALGVSATAGRYMLQHEDVGQILNGKLSALRPGDEVYVGSDGNNLRVLCNVSEEPYIERRGRADIKTNSIPTSTHIYKFDTSFKVWTEDHISGHLIKGAGEGIYYGADGIYVRDNSQLDCGDSSYETIINAYLIENESDWTGGGTWVSNRPKLYNLAKLNRIITTLGPGIYSNNSKIRVTSYSKGIGYTYEFPISGDGNDWIGLMTSYYLNEGLSPEEIEKIQCMVSTIQNEDGQKQYQPNCSDRDVYRQFIAQNSPRCEDYDELLSESHGICINDKIYELAPTMPLVTSIGENQDYCTQIKLELIGGSGDIICFGGRLGEMFIAPLFNTGPDGEYQLQPETDCS